MLTALLDIDHEKYFLNCFDLHECNFVLCLGNLINFL